MPVPVLISDLSPVAINNFPAGTNSPSVLDDVQRAHGAFVAQLRDQVNLGLSTGTTTQYASGILLSTPTQTLQYFGSTYAPLLSALPFTTSGTFETAKFRLIQGVSGADLAAPTGAALMGISQGGTVQKRFDNVFVNVKDFPFGALGNNSTDDTAAIQAALNSLIGTGGTVYMPPGTYIVNMVPHQITASYYNGLTIPSGVKLVGAGKTATIIKLASNQTIGIDTASCSIVYNRLLTGGDIGIEMSYLTIDGNGQNQTKLFNGITLVRTRGSNCKNVKVLNVKGTTNFPPNETFHFETQLGLDTTFTDCEVAGTTGTHGSGFSADNCTNVSWVNCTAYGMTAGHGFTAYQVINPAWSNCFAYLNGSHGFNCEESLSPIWTNCHSGGKSAVGTTPFPYPAGITLGNTQAGFVANGCARSSLIGCSSTKNVGAGFVGPAGSATYGPCSGSIIGGDFSENNVAFSFSSLSTSSLWRITNSLSTGNITTTLDIPTGYQFGAPGPASVTPAIPASSIGVTNQYPFDVDVYVIGGVGTLVQINGVNTNNTLAGLYHLVPGQVIKIFYSTAPTWSWFLV